MNAFTDKTGDRPAAFTNARLDKLIVSIINHRARNGSEISEADTAREVTEANNSSLDIAGYSSSPQTKLTNKPRLTLAGAKKACNAIINVAMGNVVSDIEIQRRWHICRNCPQMTSVSDCMSCGGAGKVSSLISSARTLFKKNIRLTHDAAGRYCGQCGCSMALLLPTTMQNQKEESDSENDLRPADCWLNRNSDNYQP